MSELPPVLSCGDTSPPKRITASFFPATCYIIQLRSFQIRPQRPNTVKRYELCQIKTNKRKTALIITRKYENLVSSSVLVPAIVSAVQNTLAEANMISITQRKYSTLSVITMMIATALMTFLNCRPFCGGLCVDWGFPLAFLTRTDVMINHEWQYLHRHWALIIDLAVASALVFGLGQLCEWMQAKKEK